MCVYLAIKLADVAGDLAYRQAREILLGKTAINYVCGLADQLLQVDDGAHLRRRKHCLLITASPRRNDAEACFLGVPPATPEASFGFMKDFFIRDLPAFLGFSQVFWLLFFLLFLPFVEVEEEELDASPWPVLN